MHANEEAEIKKLKQKTQKDRIKLQQRRETIRRLLCHTLIYFFADSLLPHIAQKRQRWIKKVTAAATRDTKML